MPEDPFQDDPVQPPSAPPSPTGMNDAGGPALSQNTRDLPNTKLWRASSASLEPGIPSAPMIAPSIAAERPAVAPSLLASYPTADREEAALVSAAAWTVDDGAKAGMGVKARRNPLRDR
jgi:hypothetical protein